MADIAEPVRAHALIDNSAFLPPADAQVAHEAFSGTLGIGEAPMFTIPVEFKSDQVLGKDPQLFPGVALSFVSIGDNLVPQTQDIIRNGSLGGGRSFWDIIVQPGKVWSEATDDGWSRASFPFSLMNSIEGETHNGVATFLYKGTQVSRIRYQILTQTSPFYVEDYFTASGALEAAYKPGKLLEEASIKATYETSQAVAEKILPWSELEKKFGKDKLAGFDSKIRPAEIVLDGLSIDDSFYLKSCPTPVGELPFCDRQRFGVWSVTKSAGNTAAMLAIAEKYGPEIFDTRLVDYITEARDAPGWKDVTFGDALNMATGMGNGSDKATPAAISDPLGKAYYAWYEARTTKDKIDALLKGAKPYPWGPGKVARYRDEDMFLLGVAMTRYLQSKEGPAANVWDFLKREVYQPIGISYAPINKTIEADPKQDQPLMAYGFYPTIGDLIKIARLYQNGGKFQGRQIFNAQRLADLMPAKQAVGLATGNPEKPEYYKAFWRSSYKAASGCTFSFPIMDGWGENYVLLLPKDVTVFRLAKNWDGDAGAGELGNMTAVAGRLKDLCD
ncbi:serine hydrolase [Rhizobium sp. KVB221]|uniref:Serine hydrolase n=2 Tax=Rhizobium setariae TaxID=2801340 RepID=A0A936YP54_9HYPH|nr:serine hydrolase [Rhizobium setariae]